MITTMVDEQPWGMTVSACCSVSDSPPMILVSLLQNTVSAQIIVATGLFGVSVLSERHLEVAEYGAASGTPKFIGRFCATNHTLGTPRVLGALAHLDCEVEQTVSVADHVVIIGRVGHVSMSTSDDRPLLYYSRGFRRVGRRMLPAERLPAIEGYEDSFYTVAEW
jgi:flavin reductase ActVB